MATTPETSDHTSMSKRVQALKQHQEQPHKLLPFAGSPSENMLNGIAFTLQDYCELVDITRRITREDKAGHRDQYQSPILERLGLSAEQRLTLTTEFEQHFCYAAGAEKMINNVKIHTQHQRIRGMGKAKVLLCRA